MFWPGKMLLSSLRKVPQREESPFAGTRLKYCDRRGKGPGAVSGGLRQSLRKLESALGVSEQKMRQTTDKDLWSKSYTVKVPQMLSEAARTKLVARRQLVTTTCEFLKEGVLAPNIPDLNPLDYRAWIVVERVAKFSIPIVLV